MNHFAITMGIFLEPVRLIFFLSLMILGAAIDPTTDCREQLSGELIRAAVL